MPPLAVRVKVAERQLRQIAPSIADACARGYETVHPNNKEKLENLLGWLRFEMDLPACHPMALDHDPALILRLYNPRIKEVAARYTPHAHDPNALIYREKADHGQKTTGRRPGAERTITTKGSDVGLKTKFARLERKKAKKAEPLWLPGKFGHGGFGGHGSSGAKIPRRPFPKGRGFR